MTFNPQTPAVWLGKFHQLRQKWTPLERPFTSRTSEVEFHVSGIGGNVLCTVGPSPLHIHPVQCGLTETNVSSKQSCPRSTNILKISKIKSWSYGFWHVYLGCGLNCMSCKCGCIYERYYQLESRAGWAVNITNVLSLLGIAHVWLYSCHLRAGVIWPLRLSSTEISFLRDQI